MTKKEVLICVICKRDIREINCHPIYSKKHKDVICSQCCILGALISLKIIDESELNRIPVEIRKEIMKIYEKK